jgi:hypothetical protein
VAVGEAASSRVRLSELVTDLLARLRELLLQSARKKMQRET